MNVENQRYVGLTYELKLIVPIDQHLDIVYYQGKMKLYCMAILKT